MFNGSGTELFTINQNYHYRTVGPLAFRTDSAGDGGCF
jgi:hypothetical protein